MEGLTRACAGRRPSRSTLSFRTSLKPCSSTASRQPRTRQAAAHKYMPHSTATPTTPPRPPLPRSPPLHGAQLLADLAQAVEHRLQRLSRGLEVHGLHVAHDALPHGRLGDLRARALRGRTGGQFERGAVRAPASGPARSGSPSGRQCWQRSSRPHASRRPRAAATRSAGCERRW